jgi:hypothetical protein
MLHVQPIVLWQYVTWSTHNAGRHSEFEERREYPSEEYPSEEYPSEEYPSEEYPSDSL